MTVVQSPLPAYIDTAIVGAGPHALTLVTHLLQKSKKFHRKFLVFDPSGQWTSRWIEQFQSLQIPHLRSPAVHQPDPDPYALRSFAIGRHTELFPPYDLPGAQIFADFCADLVRRWQLTTQICPHQVLQLRVWERGYQLRLDDDRSIQARRVVLAHRGGFPHWPDWAVAAAQSFPSQRLQHSSQIDLRQISVTGAHLLIVGGGLTSGHLAVGAIAAGARVTMMHRRTFYAKLFDADPGWLGPKYLKGFEAEPDWMKRWELVKNARNGGSLTPNILSQLRTAEKSGQLNFLENCEVRQANWVDAHWLVMCHDQQQLECDHIWLATGTRLNAEEEPLLQDLSRVYPNQIVRGLPILDEYLRWPKSQVFLMGGLAALRVGPTARNISGARMASQRIVPALTKASI